MLESEINSLMFKEHKKIRKSNKPGLLYLFQDEKEVAKIPTGDIEIEVSVQIWKQHLNFNAWNSIECKTYMDAWDLLESIQLERHRENSKSKIDDSVTNYSNSGYVYLFKGSNGLYKIGVSKDPNKRLTDLRRASCENHELIFTIKLNKPYELESRLHKMFKDKRSHSEWFELDDSDVEYIMSLKDTGVE